MSARGSTGSPPADLLAVVAREGRPAHVSRDAGAHNTRVDGGGDGPAGRFRAGEHLFSSPGPGIGKPVRTRHGRATRDARSPASGTSRTSPGPSTDAGRAHARRPPRAGRATPRRSPHPDDHAAV